MWACGTVRSKQKTLVDHFICKTPFIHGGETASALAAPVRAAGFFCAFSLPLGLGAPAVRSPLAPLLLELREFFWGGGHPIPALVLATWKVQEGGTQGPGAGLPVK